MDPIIEAIAKLFPLGAWFEYWGWDKNLGEAISIVIITLLLTVLVWGVKKLLGRQRIINTARDLMPQFDEAAVNQARRIYIPTRFQNASPTLQDEPGFSHQYVSTSPLVPFFINNAFNNPKESERFYIVLADSGMGKTTFMINLYMAYNSFFNRRNKSKMRLLRFSHPDTMQEINEITKEEAKKTILLLDALDEDPNIVSKDPNITDEQAFQRRVNEIIEHTRNFREIVMTCRTQYFPGQEDNPYELSVKRPDEKGLYKLNKLYISPFNDKEVSKYLNKKFGYWPHFIYPTKKEALDIVNRCKYLVMRPMILSYIDLLIGHNIYFNSLYEVYDTLVNKWLEREAEKRKPGLQQKEFIENLDTLSKEIAFIISDEMRTKKKGFSITKDKAVEIAVKNDIPLNPEEITGQSLLTCDGSGNWKFAHKSILEFFIAKRIISDFKGAGRLNLGDLDMSVRFFTEKNPYNLRQANITIETDEPIPDEMISGVHYKIWVSSVFVKKVKENNSNIKSSIIDSEKAVTFISAIQHCNLLNLHHGYPPHYDSLGNFINMDTTFLSHKRNSNLEALEISLEMCRQFKGFRLLTSFELVSSESELGVISANQTLDEWCMVLHIGPKGNLQSSPASFSHNSRELIFADLHSYLPFRIVFFP